MRKLAGWTDYFVISSGVSNRQVRAIADKILEKLNPIEGLNYSLEGDNDGGWILIDTGSVVAHIFLQEQRGFYNLENLWGDAPKIEPSLA